MRRIHTIAFKDEDYEVTSATTPEEILTLGKASSQKHDELTVSGIQIRFFRKPKRLGDMKKLDDKVEKTVDRFLCSA